MPPDNSSHFLRLSQPQFSKIHNGIFPPSYGNVFAGSGGAFIGEAVEVLVKHTTQENVLQVSQLVNQVIVQAKRPAVSLVDFIFVPYVRKYEQILGSYAYLDNIQHDNNTKEEDQEQNKANHTIIANKIQQQHKLQANPNQANGNSENGASAAYSSQFQERDEVMRCYLGFLRHILATSDFHGALTQPKNKKTYEKILQNVLDGCASPDINVVKQCLMCLESMLKWGVDLDKSGDWKSFYGSEVTLATVKALLSSAMKPNDAKASLALSSLVQIHQMQGKHYGGSGYIEFLLRTLRQAGLGGLEGYVRQLSMFVSSASSDSSSQQHQATATLKNYLRDALRAVKKPRQQHKNNNN
eukprot:CAMPEP_0197539872 /NCGR_PEP_ID=MMETSP1318-20131121/64051_1 /TAXON_ID=552666 /ORGANISM="Partenskyella glossopodia, Strain RCC365" /LENGTH=354 /DNA_ID=CAMNT_0043098703 /DNA_START=275 /DNA_END=1340 /DNA_ORIENTATION=+